MFQMKNMSANVTAMHTWFADIDVEMDMLYQSGDSDVYLVGASNTQWKEMTLDMLILFLRSKYNKRFCVSCGRCFYSRKLYV